jgi:putative serine protease PepD
MVSMLAPRGRRLAAAFMVGALAVTTVAACSSGGPQAGSLVPLQRGYERAIRMDLGSVVQIDAGKSTGSGVVFDSKGDIVTNAHVVEGVSKFEVLATPASKPLSARLVGSFGPDDLAVIRVTSGDRDLQPVRWANSNQAQVGQVVLAMGNPFGLTDSVTQGIVSALGRTVTEPTAAGKPPMGITNALQTSAAINPGNSGGALVLLSGAVLGIPTLTASNPNKGVTAEGIGFAIPANTVRSIATQLIQHGRVVNSDRAALQVTATTHTDLSGTADGVSVDAATPGGAAATAGIKTGDIIVGFAGRNVATLADLDGFLIGYRPGDLVKVDVLRNGKRREFTVKLGSLSSGQV